MTALTRATGITVDAPTSRKKKRTEASITAAPTQSAKAQLDQAIEAAFGLLKGKDVLPLDALQFDREMRDE